MHCERWYRLLSTNSATSVVLARAPRALLVYNRRVAPAFQTLDDLAGEPLRVVVHRRAVDGGAFEALEQLPARALDDLHRDGPYGFLLVRVKLLEEAALATAFESSTRRLRITGLCVLAPTKLFASSGSSFNARSRRRVLSVCRGAARMACARATVSAASLMRRLDARNATRLVAPSCAAKCATRRSTHAGMFAMSVTSAIALAFCVKRRKKIDLRGLSFLRAGAALHTDGHQRRFVLPAF